jgi:hypothetical protein
VTNDGSRPTLSPREALHVAIRELQHRRRGIQRRGLARDPRYMVLVAELTIAAEVLEQLVRALETAG